MGGCCSRSGAYAALVDNTVPSSYTKERNQDRALAKILEERVRSTIGSLEKACHIRSDNDYTNRIYLIKADSISKFSCCWDCACYPKLKDGSGNYVTYFWYTNPEVREDILGDVNDIVYFNRCLKNAVILPTTGYYSGARLVFTVGETGKYLWLEVKEGTATPV